MINFTPKGLIFAPRGKEKMSFRQEIMESDQPKIIISSGGDASYGAITNYIDHYLPRNDALIHLLGYCSPESQGYKILNTPLGDEINYNGHIHKMCCSVAKTSELSGHAPRNKLLKLINYFPNTKSIIINHGEQEVMKSFREYLLEYTNLSEEMVEISRPEVAFCIEAKGITDKIKTNFESIL